MSPDPLTAELLANGPFARADAPYRLVEVKGPQAGEFLQRLCTQDLIGLAEGVVAPAAFLDNKGKLLATCLAFRIGESFWLETHAEQVEKLAALLERYHFSEKLTIAPVAPRKCWEMVFFGGNSHEQDRASRDGETVLVGYERRGVRFTRSHGGPLVIERLHDDGHLERIEQKPLTPEFAECLRMATGLVRIGLETEPSTLALEAGLDDHCSTTKGCYTGQEIVARIHTYGHVNRKLCLLHLPAGPEITTPTPLLEPEDKVAVGRVLHAVPVPERPLRVGLGYLPKDFQALGTKLLLEDGGAVTVAGFGDAGP